MAFINTPQLNSLSITFFNDIVFDTPQFIQFISHTPKLRILEKAHITLFHSVANLDFSLQKDDYKILEVEILCRGLDWQVSSLEQICTLCLPPLSMLNDLYIYDHRDSQLYWKDNIENGLGLELLRPFIGVKNHCLLKNLEAHILSPARDKRLQACLIEHLVE